MQKYFTCLKYEYEGFKGKMDLKVIHFCSFKNVTVFFNVYIVTLLH